MKAIDNQIRNISSSHQDKHSDKVNSHQHHGKVDKTHRAKIVEFDKLDNDSQIDNDFGRYRYCHGCSDGYVNDFGFVVVTQSF